MNEETKSNEAQAVGKPVVGDEPAAPAAVGSHAGLDGEMRITTALQFTIISLMCAVAKGKDDLGSFMLFVLMMVSTSLTALAWVRWSNWKKRKPSNTEVSHG